MNEKRRLLTNTLANGASQAAAMVASLVFMPLLIDAFGLEAFGLYMLATSVSAYAVLLDLGIGSALVKLVAEHDATRDRDSLIGATSTATLLYALVGVAAAVLMASIGWFSASLFDVSAAGAGLLRQLLIAGALFQIWYWPSSAARHILGGLQRYDVLAGTAVVSTVLSIAATWYVLATGAGPLALVVLNGVVMVVVSIANLIASRMLSGLPSVRFVGLHRSQVRTIFAFSWAVFVIQVADVLFYQQTDRLLLGVFAGATAVAFYEAAAKFNAIVSYVSGLSVSAILPLASSMQATGREASLHSLLVRGTKYVTALIAPIAVTLALYAKPLIARWLGPDFAEQALVAQVLVIPHVLMALGLVGDSIVISKGRLGPRVPYIIAQAVVNVVLSALLIPRLGVLGVAVGTSVAHLIDFPFHMRFLARETGLTLRDGLRSIVAPTYPQLLVIPLVTAGFARTALWDSLAGLGVAVAMSAVAYWVLFAVTGLAGWERRELLSTVSARLARRDRA